MPPGPALRLGSVVRCNTAPSLLDHRRCERGSIQVRAHLAESGSVVVDGHGHVRSRHPWLENDGDLPASSRANSTAVNLPSGISPCINSLSMGLARACPTAVAPGSSFFGQDPHQALQGRLQVTDWLRNWLVGHPTQGRQEVSVYYQQYQSIRPDPQHDADAAALLEQVPRCRP